MKRYFLVLLVFGSILQSNAEVYYRAADTLLTRDSNNSTITGVFAQGNAANLVLNGTSATTSSIFRTLIGSNGDVNGDTYVIRIVATDAARYSFATSPAVNGNTGSLLPANAIEYVRVRAGDKAAVLKNTAGTGKINITRLR
jgi:hypothetical protein